jgi:outer membrane immunogenic protein
MALRSIVIAGMLAAVLSSASAAMAQDQEGTWHEVAVQGTGFFTKDSQGNGIAQHSTDTGGFLVNYRLHFNRWLGAEAGYGFARNTLQNSTIAGPFNIEANVHQATGALVARIPLLPRFSPYALAGTGALIFDPTGKVGASVTGADRQAKPTFVYGGGVNLGIIKHVSIRVEYRGFVYKAPDFGVATLDSGATRHTAEPSAGIAFNF